jgi:hypothetical protein
MNAKLTVVLHPATASVGLIAPQVGMPVLGGTLTAASGGVVTVTRPDGSSYHDYTHNVRMLAAEAAGFGWPWGPGSVQSGHVAGDRTGPALRPPRLVGDLLPFQTTTPNPQIQTYLEAGRLPRTCLLGTSAAVDLAPFAADPGAVFD